MNFNCAKCGDEMTEPGGQAFSPPLGGRGGVTVEHFNICPPCWGYFLRWLYCKGEPIFPLPPVKIPEPARQPDEWSPPWVPDFPTTAPFRPPYRITCETGVPAGGSLTPR